MAWYNNLIKNKAQKTVVNSAHFWQPDVVFLVGINDSNPSLSDEALFEQQKEDIANTIILNDNTQNIKFNYCDLKALYPCKTNITNLTWIDRGEVVAGSFMMHVINKDISAADIDIYFKTRDDVKAFCDVNQIFIKNSIDNHEFCVTVYFRSMKLNLIWCIPYVSTENLLSSFDIRGCAIAFDPNTNILTAVNGSIHDCTHLDIVFQTNPRSVSVARLVKYINKGFTINKYQRVIFAELIKSGRHSNDLELVTNYGTP